MNLPKTLHNYNFIKHLSSKSSQNASKTWRNQAQQQNLTSQISTILLQRHNWQPLLKSLPLASQLTPQTFLQILHKIQSNPQISLNFFTWVKSNFVKFQPDLKIHCKLVQISLSSRQYVPIKSLLDSIIGVYPVDEIVYHMILACKDTNLHNLAFSFIIGSYAQKGLYVEGLEVYRRILLYDYLPNAGCLNIMLDVLYNVGELKLACCLYGSAFRNGISLDFDSWSVIARILCKSGKFDSVVKLLDSGVCNLAVFELVVDGYSRIGDFQAAFDRVEDMCRRNFEPGFYIYGSMLDGACKLRDENVINTVMCAMREKELVPKDLLLEYDDVVRRFCDLGWMYAAEYLFKRARYEGIRLDNLTFERMLDGFCEGGRVNEAVWLYGIISKERIVVHRCCCQGLADCLCKEEPSEDIIRLLVRLIKRGFSPSVSEISKFVMKLGRKDSWMEVEDLLKVMLPAELLPDSGCCRLLVKHYCSSGQLEKVLTLHDKLVKSEISWDVTTYNVLLRSLLMNNKVDEALSIFECMRKKNVVNRASFLVMISGLSREKEMRKAMQFHDEMLKLGLKPGPQTYKSLISVFR